MVLEFQSEGLVVDNEEIWYLTDLSAPSDGATGVCPVMSIVNSQQL